MSQGVLKKKSTSRTHTVGRQTFLDVQFIITQNVVRLNTKKSKWTRNIKTNYAPLGFNLSSHYLPRFNSNTRKCFRRWFAFSVHQFFSSSHTRSDARTMKMPQIRLRKCFSCLLLMYPDPKQKLFIALLAFIAFLFWLFQYRKKNGGQKNKKKNHRRAKALRRIELS